MKQIYANWRLKCGENRRLKLTVVGETGPKLSAELLSKVYRLTECRHGICVKSVLLLSNNCLANNNEFAMMICFFSITMQLLESLLFENAC